MGRFKGHQSSSSSESSSKHHNNRKVNGDLLVKKNLKVRGDAEIDGELKVDDRLKVKEDAHFEDGVKIDGKLKVKGDTTLTNFLATGSGSVLGDLAVGGTLAAPSITVGKQFILPFVNTFVVSPIGKKGDLVYDISTGNPNDAVLKVSDGTQWLTIPENPVGGVYVIKPDGTGAFPTIQSGIKYCSSGLKPIANSNLGPKPPPGSADVILSIDKGDYEESLSFDNSFACGSNDPSSPLKNLQTGTLFLDGDGRPVANFTYMDGALVRCDFSYTTGVGQNNLGALNSIVSLTNSGNTITVTLSKNPQPDFVACGVVNGNFILVTDNNGNVQDRTVISALGNTVTYSGSPVSISGIGAALTFEADRRIISAVPDFFCFVQSGEAKIRGLWFAGNPLFTSTAILALALEGASHLFFLNIGIDARNLTLQNNAVTQNSYARLEGRFGGGSITGHMSVVGGNMLIDTVSNLFGGFYYIMTASGETPAGCLVTNRGCTVLVDSVQANGAGVISGDVDGPGSVMQINTLLAFNAAIGVSLGQGATAMNVTQALSINNCTTGISIVDGNLDLPISAPFNGMTPSINNCATAISINRNGQMSTNFNLNITGATTTAFRLTNGSKLTCSQNITYPASANTIVDVTSLLLTAQNAASPNDIFTYPSSAVPQIMNSVYLNQTIPNIIPMEIDLDPSATATGVTLYVGKTYKLYATGSAAQTHLFRLTTGNFTGVGSSGKTMATFAGLSEGEGLTILVISTTRVQVIAFDGLTFT